MESDEILKRRGPQKNHQKIDNNKNPKKADHRKLQENEENENYKDEISDLRYSVMKEIYPFSDNTEKMYEKYFNSNEHDIFPNYNPKYNDRNKYYMRSSQNNPDMSMESDNTRDLLNSHPPNRIMSNPDVSLESDNTWNLLSDQRSNRIMANPDISMESDNTWDLLKEHPSNRMMGPLLKSKNEIRENKTTKPKNDIKLKGLNSYNSQYNYQNYNNYPNSYYPPYNYNKNTPNQRYNLKKYTPNYEAYSGYKTPYNYYPDNYYPNNYYPYEIPSTTPPPTTTTTTTTTTTPKIKKFKIINLAKKKKRKPKTKVTVKTKEKKKKDSNEKVTVKVVDKNNSDESGETKVKVVDTNSGSKETIRISDPNRVNIKERNRILLKGKKNDDFKGLLADPLYNEQIYDQPLQSNKQPTQNYYVNSDFPMVQSNSKVLKETNKNFKMIPPSFNDNNKFKLYSDNKETLLKNSPIPEQETKSQVPEQESNSQEILNESNKQITTDLDYSAPIKQDYLTTTIETIQKNSKLPQTTEENISKIDLKTIDKRDERLDNMDLKIKFPKKFNKQNNYDSFMEQYDSEIPEDIFSNEE